MLCEQGLEITAAAGAPGLAEDGLPGADRGKEAPRSLVAVEAQRALGPHSRGCWSNVHDPRPFIPAPLAACGKARALSAG